MWSMLGKTSPKARITLAVFAVIIIAAVFWRFSRTRSTKTSSAPKIAHTIVRADLINDTDNDGLRDWEETLFRTNPQKADTDGDGVDDGEEIRKGHDPLRPGPDDFLATSTARVAQTFIGATPETENLTERVAGLFVTQYLTPRLADSAFTPNPELLGRDAAETSIAKALQQDAAPQFSLRDLSRAPADDKETIRAYLAQLSQTVQLSFKKTPRAELLIQKFLGALEKENYSSLKDFDQYLAEYDSFFNRIKDLNVPSSFTKLHLQYLNTAAQEYAGLKRMRAAADDAVGALAGFRKYLDAAGAFLKLVRDFETAYRAKGITP